jgi:hypothetical protein
MAGCPMDTGHAGVHGDVIDGIGSTELLDVAVVCVQRE